MRRTLFTLIAAAATTTATAVPALACGPYGAPDLPTLAAYATSENEETAIYAIGLLREAGPAGLDALLATHADLIESGRRHMLESTVAPDDPAWPRLQKAIDRVGGQHDNVLSPLFWHTDIERAKAASASSGRPILSLRLLGRLDEDYSCANSRYFRTAIYANADLAKVLREQFVLHWKTVRPVPRITIDFGDGREVVRTITGNCAHHVLDSEGRPIDVIPGLYGPQAFQRALAASFGLHWEITRAGASERAGILARFHRSAVNHIKFTWAQDLLRLGVALPGEEPRPAVAAGAAPPAIIAAPIAMSKSAIELPVLAAMRQDASQFEAATDDGVWTRLATLHADDGRLDSSSVALIKMKMFGAPTVMQATLITASKRRVESPLTRAVRNFEASLARDSIYNEYVLHRAIHEWFVDGAIGDDAQALNDRIYDELFLTPGWDPWLGLVPADTYAALDRNGLPRP